MEPHLLIACRPKLYKYDQLELGINHVRHLKPCRSIQNKPKRKSMSLDCVFIYYFVKELHISWFYRNRFIQCLSRWGGPDMLILLNTRKDLIDYNWNERIYQMVRERCEVDHAFSWLSTLGGAFSALGDYFGRCAEMAGKISFNQLKLALRIDYVCLTSVVDDLLIPIPFPEQIINSEPVDTYKKATDRINEVQDSDCGQSTNIMCSSKTLLKEGDPSLQARCRLYLSISLIQKKKFNLASDIIKGIYHSAKYQQVKDTRLEKMCKGIWAKLQYEYDIYRKNKKVDR